MRHKSKNKTRPLFTLSLEMTRLVKETRLLLVPRVNSDIYRKLLCDKYEIAGAPSFVSLFPCGFQSRSGSG